MKVYLVVELYKNGEPPRTIGCFKHKADANRAAYDPTATHWRNVIPLTVQSSYKGVCK